MAVDLNTAVLLLMLFIPLTNFFLFCFERLYPEGAFASISHQLIEDKLFEQFAQCLKRADWSVA